MLGLVAVGVVRVGGVSAVCRNDQAVASTPSRLFRSGVEPDLKAFDYRREQGSRGAGRAPAAHFFVIEESNHRDSRSRRVSGGDERVDREKAGQLVVDAGGGDELFVQTDDGGRGQVEGHGVPRQDVVECHFERGGEVAPKVHGAGNATPHRHHVPLLVELEARVADLVIEVNSQLGHSKDRPIISEEADGRTSGRTNHDSSGQAEIAIKP